VAKATITEFDTATYNVSNFLQLDDGIDNNRTDGNELTWLNFQ